MTLYDEIRHNSHSVLEYSGIAPRELPDKLFYQGRHGQILIIMNRRHLFPVLLVLGTLLTPGTWSLSASAQDPVAQNTPTEEAHRPSPGMISATPSRLSTTQPSIATFSRRCLRR
jgi:hypothetical protein